MTDVFYVNKICDAANKWRIALFVKRLNFFVNCMIFSNLNYMIQSHHFIVIM
jgi:hypothetical protein